MTVADPKSGKSRESRDLVFGLDFGTSCTKVVIRDAATRQAFAIPLRPQLQGIDRWLFPTGIQGQEEVTIGNLEGAVVDLKVRLMDAVERGAPEPELLQAQARCVAYLSLVIGAAIEYFGKEWRDVYANADITWWLTVGVPSPGVETTMAGAFRAVALAAWHIAREKYSVNENKAKQTLEALRAGTLSIPESDRINVYPEVAAEVVGYSRSDARRGGLHLMVDIGASTLDISTFILGENAGDAELSFLESAVTRQGVYFLHQHRVNAIAALVSARCNPLNQMSPVPDNPAELLPEAKDVEGVDAEFGKSASGRVAKIVRRTKSSRAPREPQFRAANPAPLPVFLCGGGSKMMFYHDLVIGVEKGLHAAGVTNIGKFVASPLVKSAEFVADGLPSLEYHRLAVAHGLSFPWLDMPRVFGPTEIEDIQGVSQRSGTNPITKDDM